MNVLTNSLLASVLLCCGCATNGYLRNPPPSPVALITADRDFALYARLHGVANAFREFAAPEAISFPMGEAPIHGRDAIFQAMQNLPKGELSWEPVGSDLAYSGELGYTWGTYEFRTQDAEGTPATRHGKYVTVWKKQPGGPWKFVADIGNASPPPR